MRCEKCGNASEDVIPFGDSEYGYTWLHLSCWQTWRIGKEKEMANGYPPGGALFNNTRKTSANAPDVTGNLEISQELLDHLNDCARRGAELKMDLSGWKKQSRNGGSFFSLSARVPYVKDAAPPPPPVRQEQRPPARQVSRPPPSAFDLDDEIPF